MMQSTSSFSSLRLTLRPITTTKERERERIEWPSKEPSSSSSFDQTECPSRIPAHHAFTHWQAAAGGVCPIYNVVYATRPKRNAIENLSETFLVRHRNSLSLYWLVVCKPFRFNILSGPSKEKNALLSGSLANTLAGCCKREKVKKSFILLYSLSLFGYSISRVHYSRRVYISKRGKGGDVYYVVCENSKRDRKSREGVADAARIARGPKGAHKTRRWDTYCIFAIYLTTEEDFVDVYLTMSTVLRLQWRRETEREGVCDRRGEESFSDFQRSGREKSRRVCENGRHKALRLLNKRKGHGEHHGMLDFVCVRHVWSGEGDPSTLLFIASSIVFGDGLWTRDMLVCVYIYITFILFIYFFAFFFINQLPLNG